MQYELKGGAFPVVVCRLNSGESMITEKGSMVWMTPNMEMTTTGGGGIGKMFSKALTGESMFQNIYTARGEGMITFGSSFPGQILPLEVTPGKSFILQKSAFLASEAGVQLSMHVNQKLGAGFSAAKASSCRSLPATASPLQRWTANWWNTPSPPASSWWSIPAM